MAKRFTDTAKWDKAWYRKLGSRLRDIRQFCLDRCDHAGVLEMDFETFEHFIGSPVSQVDIEAAFQGKLSIVGDKYFFPDFIEFQYKCLVTELNPANKVHLSVIKRLEKLDLSSPSLAPRQGAMQGAKDKDKELDKDKDRLFKTGEELYAAIPIMSLEAWNHEYGADFVRQETPKCFAYWTLNSAKTPRTPGQWFQKLFSWLSLTHKSALKEKTKTDSSFTGFAKEPS